MSDLGRKSPVVVTATGAVVNEAALQTYNEAYRMTGDRASALAQLWDEAVRENWARNQVAKAGKSWSTHLAKFDGTVLPR
jgi:hypothetical protein